MAYREEEIARMYADYQSGMTAAEVGKKWFAAESSVYELFERHGLPRRSSHTRKIKAEDMPKIIELRAQGKTYDEIGSMYGCANSTVIKAYKCYGMEDRKIKLIRKSYGMTSQQRHEETLKMYEMYKQGASKREIARKFGYEPYTVYARFRREGLPQNIARPEPYNKRNTRMAFDDVRKAYSEYTNGTPVKVLAQTYNCSWGTLYMWFRRLKLNTARGKSYERG